MKTSIILDESLARAAKGEAARTGRSMSELISQWARLGREVARAQKKNEKKSDFKPADLGGHSQIDLTSRREWLDKL